MPDPETDPFAAIAVDLAAEHKEEKRKRRMARSPSFATTSIETPGFLKKEKPDIPDNAVISLAPPPRPNVGCAWNNPDTGQTKYWHGTAWYLSPPAPAAVRAAEPEPTMTAADTLAALDGPLDAKFETFAADDDEWDAAEPDTDEERWSDELEEMTTAMPETTTASAEPVSFNSEDDADFVGAKKPADPEHGDKWWKGDGEMRWFWAVDENGAEKNRWFQRPPAGHADYDAFYADTVKPEAKAAPATVKENVTVEPHVTVEVKPKAEPKLYEEPQFDDEPVTEFTIPAGTAFEDDELVTFADEPALYDFDTGALVCEVRDAMLEQIKHRPKPWGKMAEAEQRDMVAGLENVAEGVVRGVLEKLAAEDDSSIRCLLESYQEKDGIKIVMKLQAFGEEETEKAILFLHRARGKAVMARHASLEDYHGHVDAETMPDQPEIDWNAQVTDAYGGDNSDLGYE